MWTMRWLSGIREWWNVHSSSFFKPSIQMDKVTLSLISSLPKNIQNFLKQQYASPNTVLVASSVSIDGIMCSPDMIVSVGSCSCLPKFRQIHNILVINSDILCLCKHMTSYYNEHLRSYKLCSHVSSMSVNMLSDLNEPFPLAAYRIRGRTFVTHRHYILCWLDAKDFDVKCHEVTQLIF